MKVTLTWSPDNGVEYWYQPPSGGDIESGGLDGQPEEFSPDGWMEYVRAEMPIPPGPRDSWAGAVAVPFGWSDGAGHTPQGVEITWEDSEEDAEW